MPANRGRGINARLNNWLTLFRERPELKKFPSPEAVDRAFAQLYASREGTDHLGLQNAAKFLDLDPQNPAHRALLLYVLVDVVFHLPRKGRPKRPTKWGKDKLLVLGLRADALNRRAGNLSGEDTAKELKKTFEDYRHVSGEAIRQHLAVAKRVTEEVQGLFASRAHDLGLSLMAYAALLVREEGLTDERSLDEATRTVFGPL